MKEIDALILLVLGVIITFLVLWPPICKADSITYRAPNGTLSTIYQA